MEIKLYPLIVLTLMIWFFLITIIRIADRSILKENFWQEWKRSLSYQELMGFYTPTKTLDSVPEKTRVALKRRIAEANAFEYYKSEIFPVIQKMKNLPALSDRYAHVKILIMLEMSVEEDLYLEWQECIKWIRSLNDKELMEFYVPAKFLYDVPEKAKNLFKRHIALSNAYQYFELEIWPSIQQRIIGSQKQKISISQRQQYMAT